MREGWGEAGCHKHSVSVRDTPHAPTKLHPRSFTTRHTQVRQSAQKYQQICSTLLIPLPPQHRPTLQGIQRDWGIAVSCKGDRCRVLLGVRTGWAACPQTEVGENISVP